MQEFRIILGQPKYFENVAFKFAFFPENCYKNPCIKPSTYSFSKPVEISQVLSRKLLKSVEIFELYSEIGLWAQMF